MANQNICMFTGRMGRAVEIRYGQSGIAVGTTSIAVSEKYKGEEKTQWVRLVFFGKGAEIMEKYTDKGSLIRVSAKYQNRQYERDGQTQYISEFLVNDFEFLGSRQDQSGQSGGYRQQDQDGNQNQATQNVRNAFPGSQQMDDMDIPF